jgi:hypothetical protein
MPNTLSAIENLPSTDLGDSLLSIKLLITLILRVSGGIKNLMRKRGAAILNLCTGRNETVEDLNSQQQQRWRIRSANLSTVIVIKTESFPRWSVYPSLSLSRRM